MGKEIRDGDLYRIIKTGGQTFEIRYGYYEEYERERHEPVPIFPDFVKNPVHTDEGRLFVTAMQTVCPHFTGSDSELGCFGCRFYSEAADLIGICQHPKRVNNNEINGDTL